MKQGEHNMKTLAERLTDRMIEACKDSCAEYDCRFTREGPTSIKVDFSHSQAYVVIDFANCTIKDQGSMEDWFGAETKEELISQCSIENISLIQFDGDDPEDDYDVTLVLKYDSYDELRKDLSNRNFFGDLELDKIFAAKTED